jgi:hypothetical protein
MTDTNTITVHDLWLRLRGYDDDWDVVIQGADGALIDIKSILIDEDSSIVQLVPEAPPGLRPLTAEDIDSIGRSTE